MTIQAPGLGITTFEDAQAVLAEKLQGYTRRPHQEQLAGVIEQAIADKVPALAQAGCGTGKSLAALIPAVIAAHLHGTRTVFATATKALQEQYKEKDLPFLLANLGIPFTYAILKGRSNYVCLAKTADLSTPTAGQSEILRIVEAKGEDEILDRDGLPAVEDRDWAGLSMSAAECPGANACPFAEQCHAERAKAEAADADIVVTNVAYLMMDLQLRQSSLGNVALLGDYDQLVIDEAHNLPGQASGALSDTFSYRAFTSLASALENFLGQNDGDIMVVEPILSAARVLSVKVDRMYADWVASQRGKTDPMKLPLATIIDRLGDEFAALYQAIEATRAEIRWVYVEPGDKRAKAQKERMSRRVANWLNRIMLYTTDSDDQTVRWVEQEEEKGRQGAFRRNMCSAPIEVGPWLRSVIWDVTPAVLMSATLATGQGDFSYIEHQLGLKPREARTVDVGTPFDYASQAVLFVPDKDRPAPLRATETAWQSYAQVTTEALVKAAGGGALLLFTSRKNMNHAYQAMSYSFENAGLTVLKQGDAMPGELIRRFKEGNAVLFGLRTYMEGIDVPGDALRLVVLDKLPFAVPSDVLVSARADKWDRKHPARGPVPASFGDLAIPAMSLVLQQAFGRLIRHADDKGVVAILDSRLESKGYGRNIVKDLPPARKTTEVREAMTFLS
jgi:ATP-dependent DNA helicase DinG